MFTKTKFYDTLENSFIYVSLHDAVHHALSYDPALGTSSVSCLLQCTITRLNSHPVLKQGFRLYVVHRDSVSLGK